MEKFENCVSGYESVSESDIVVPVNRKLRVINGSSDSEDQMPRLQNKPSMYFLKDAL